MRSLLPVLREEGGFSLLEVSIVLAVIGILAATALPSLVRFRDQGRFQATRTHHEIVLQSLANYALTQGVLPCPASSSEPGIALASCSGAQATGQVPYKTLGLAKMYAEDGWGHPHIYAVSPELTHVQRAGLLENKTLDTLEAVCTVTKSSLSLENSPEKPLLLPSSDPLAVILVSRGTAGSHPKGEGELQNEKGDLHFVDRPYATKKENPHRHVLTWWTRDNFFLHYGTFSCPHLLLKLRLDRHNPLSLEMNENKTPVQEGFEDLDDFDGEL